MKNIRYILINIIGTLLRAFPFPGKTGLNIIGHPDRNSPVFLTCNFQVTVERVKKALKGMDAYLLIANSKGDNVWCSATGGHFTNHNVISVLKTSGIEDLVDHRNVILPQLAATGIRDKVIQKKTGWNAIWGPVYAEDIPAFIENNMEKTPRMRQVSFTLGQRLEMAIMWAFPFSVIASLILLPFRPDLLFTLNAFIWGWSLFIFITFPLYSGWFHRKKKTANFSKFTVIFDFSFIPAVIWIIFLGLLIGYSILYKNGDINFILVWGIISFVILLLLNIDLMGSTPTYKSGLHEDRYLDIILDKKNCKGAASCETVCPKNCFEVDHALHTATIPGIDDCVQCGACIVQCPYDALYFKSPKGEILTPQSIREYKLNLIGKRLVKVN
jgi:NAD-dependent dihydropyrimidine dehydrogenase PreA subunit